MKAWLSIFIIACFFVVGCGKTEKQSEPDPQSLRKEIPPTEVKTVIAERKPFEYLIQAAARIEPVNEVQVKFRRAGTIREIHIRNGQYIKKGDILALLDFERQELQRQKARLAYEEKLLAFRDQMLNYHEADSLRRKRAAETLRITTGLAAAELALREAELEYQYTFVRAEINGIVSDLQLRPGSAVAEGQVLCRLHNPAEITAVAEVLESDVAQIKPGVPAVVQVAGQESKPINGEVVLINPRVEDKSGMVKVTIKLPAGVNLLPGMRAQVVIKVPGAKHIVIPKEAVVMRSGRAVVFTAENGLAKWNYVTTGRENGQEVEILEGLEDGKAVIITNNLQLAHDAPIKIKN